MERLTIRAGALAWYRDKYGYMAADEMRENDVMAVLERLAAIEDILGDQYDLERLRKMLEEQSDYEQAAETLEKMRDEAHMRLQQAEAAEQRELESQHLAERAEAELASYKAWCGEQKERP